MSGHAVPRQFSQAPWNINDPGTAKALPNDRSGTINIITGASGETNTLAAPIRAGIDLVLNMLTDGGGDRVITVASAFDDVGTTTITLANAGDFVQLRSRKYGSSYRWYAVKNNTSNILADDSEIRFGTGSDVLVGFNGTYLYANGGAAASHGPWSHGDVPSRLDPNFVRYCHALDLDFNSGNAATTVPGFTAANDGGTGTNAYADVANGVFNVVTAAADNDYHAMASNAESWLFVAGKKLWFEAKFKVAEATTNESAWWFGLTDTLTTGGFQADTGGPLASYDGALIWKDEATMAIDFETSNAGTQATTTNMGTFVTDTWTRIGFHFDGTATTSVITPYISVDDGVWVAGTAQNITLSGLAEMHAVFGIKAGPTAGAETLQVDYFRIWQLR